MPTPPYSLLSSTLTQSSQNDFPLAHQKQKNLGSALSPLPTNLSRESPHPSKMSFSSLPVLQ